GAGREVTVEQKEAQSKATHAELHRTGKARGWLERGNARRRNGANWRNAVPRATRNESPARRLSSMLFDIRKTLALPPSFAEQWREAVDALRGPPTLGLRDAMDALRGPPTLGLRDAMDALRGPPTLGLR